MTHDLGACKHERKNPLPLKNPGESRPDAGSYKKQRTVTANRTIQSILRQAGVGTTMAYYAQPDRSAGEHGLRKLSNLIQKKYKIKV